MSCFCERSRLCTLFLGANTLDSWGVVPKLGGCPGVLRRCRNIHAQSRLFYKPFQALSPDQSDGSTGLLHGLCNRFQFHTLGGCLVLDPFWLRAVDSLTGFERI